MFSLRQKTYGIFIRPYVEYGGDKLIQRGGLSVRHPCQTGGTIVYTTVKDGESWILYKGELLTSYTLVRERVKEIMDELGYSTKDMHITEIIPTDIIVTPLA